jgi:DNA-binding NarL/FixJ family response regulator
MGYRLCAWTDMRVAASCTTEDRDVAEVVARVCPGMIALDIDRRGPASAMTAARLTAAAPAGRIVALTGSPGPHQAVSATRAGVVASVSRQAHLADFVATVHAADSGHAMFPLDPPGAVPREPSVEAGRSPGHVRPAHDARPDTSARSSRPCASAPSADPHPIAEVARWN